jgi:hypothetical protein
VIYDPKEISKTVQKYWKDLTKNPSGNCESSVPYDESHEYHSLPGKPGGLSDVSLNIEDIYRAISKLKNGKACGIDKIAAEFLKYGGYCLVKSLASLFRLFVLMECYPEDWHKGIVKPIHKAGNKEVLDNYRGITITSNVYKVYAFALENRLMNHLESSNCLGELQGAYRKGRRLEDNAFILKGLCALRKTKKYKTYLAFIDISKAFDTVDRTKLFGKLWEKGVQGKVWRLLNNLYKDVQNCVIFGQYETEWFKSMNGVK